MLLVPPKGCCWYPPRDAIGSPTGILSGPPAPRAAISPPPGHICFQPSRERTCPEHGCKWGGWIPSSSTDSLLGSCPSAPGNFGVHPSFPGCRATYLPRPPVVPTLRHIPAPPTLCRHHSPRFSALPGNSSDMWPPPSCRGAPATKTPPVPQPTHHLHPRCQRGGNLQTAGTPPHPVTRGWDGGGGSAGGTGR